MALPMSNGNHAENDNGSRSESATEVSFAKKSTNEINFLVRKGDPKEIKDWDDLVRARRRARRHYRYLGSRAPRNCGTAQLRGKSGGCYPS
jgi:hypothetical protein